MTWQRARQPEQKEIRTLRILQAAGELFDEWEFADISMKEIAASAGLGKASLYHYFKTKEEVFLTLYRLEMDRWLDAFLKEAKRVKTADCGGTARALVNAARENERFCGLAAVFSIVLERNVTKPFVTDFKLSLIGPIAKFSEVLQSKIPTIDDEQARQFVFQHHALIAGLWPVAHPNELVDSVMDQEALEGFRIDFFEVFESALEKMFSAMN